MHIPYSFIQYQLIFSYIHAVIYAIYSLVHQFYHNHFQRNLKNSTLIKKRYATFNYVISQISELLKRERGTTICCLQTANDYTPNFEDEV